MITSNVIHRTFHIRYRNGTGLPSQLIVTEDNT